MRRVAATGHQKAFAAGHDLAHGHFVASQRPRLVGTNHGHGTERLDAGQLADQRVPFDHALQAERERQRHHGRESFRHCRHRETDGNQQHLQQLAAAHQLQHEDDGHDDQTHHDQHFAQFRQPPLQRRWFRLGALQ